MVGEEVLAGWLSQCRHAEIAAISGLPVVSLELVDPRFYPPGRRAGRTRRPRDRLLPPAFSTAAQVSALFARRDWSATDAFVFELNAVSGLN